MRAPLSLISSPGRCVQIAAVKHSNLASDVLKRSVVLQSFNSSRNADAPLAQHVGQKLRRPTKLVRTSVPSAGPPAARLPQFRQFAQASQWHFLEPVIFLFADSIAFARQLFYARTVQLRKATTGLADQPACLQSLGRFGKAFAAHVQHV